jgi:hypothetical protein
MSIKQNINPKNIKANNSFMKIFYFLHNNVKAINDSKIFAGLMIITLNIVSKFANFKLSKTLEAYLKYTFSRQILVFVIAWMGTRDIYIALFITLIFVIFTEYLFHEESMFCVLPEEFKDYHISLLDNENNPNDISEENITQEDINKCQTILKKAKEKGLIRKEIIGVSI